MYLVNAEQMREMDRFAMDQIGIPSVVLMEAAGSQVVSEVEKRGCKGKVLILAGRGNNGGDAFVVARHLANKGYLVRTWFIGQKESMTRDCSIMFNAYINSKFSIEELNDSNHDQFALEVKGVDLIIDGLLGTGVNRPVQGDLSKVIGLVNQFRTGKVFSIDIPSGISADTGEVLANAIVADITVTFACPKWGQYLFPGAAHCGEIIVKDITIPSWVSEQSNFNSQLLQEDYIRSLLPTRDRHSHKGTYGHVLVVGGSKEYLGAPVLAAMGALRSGCGLATMAIPADIQQMVAGRMTEAICWPWPSENGAFTCDSWKMADHPSRRYDFTIIGPGIGQSPGVKWLSQMVKNTTGAILLDADALGLLAQDLNIIKGKGNVVLTPHPGEMARLIGVQVRDVEQNRPQIAREFALKHQVYLVLKGTYPIIATPKGKLFVSSRGSTSLAKGGSGDVLTGMIGAFVSQAHDLERGILLAVYIHGMAGEFMDEYSGSASDLTLQIGRSIRALA